MRNKYKYIAITKTWRDVINGNTYFSSNVEVTNEDRNYLIPFQYGYGDQSEHTICETLKINKDDIKFIKIENCLKKEVKEHGKGRAEQFYPNAENNFQGYYLLD